MHVGCMLRNQVLSGNWHRGHRRQHCVCDDTSAQTSFEGIPVMWASAAKSKYRRVQNILHTPPPSPKVWSIQRPQAVD